MFRTYAVQRPNQVSCKAESLFGIQSRTFNIKSQQQTTQRCNLNNQGPLEPV
jgi:hypothetical protein